MPNSPGVGSDASRHAVEGLRAQEPARCRAAAEAQVEVLVELAVRGVRLERQVAATAFGVEARRHRDRLDQGRLARAVVADEHGHGSERDLVE